MKIKHLVKKYFLTALLLVFVLYTQLSHWMRNSKQTGEIVESSTYQVLNSPTETEQISFPPPNQRSMVIFWASWCAPCKLEMARLKSSVEAGKISAHQIFAINSFESKLTTLKFIRENQHPFVFIDAPQVARQLDIQATPTTAFLKHNRIESLSTGISLLGIWRAEFFLK